MDGYSYLTFDQRREIEALYSDGERAVDIAAKIGRSVAAIYEELKRGYTGELDGNKDVYKRQNLGKLRPTWGSSVICQCSRPGPRSAITNFAIKRKKASGVAYFLAPALGRLAPYLERACIRLATPWASRVPRMM